MTTGRRAYSLSLGLIVAWACFSTVLSVQVGQAAGIQQHGAQGAVPGSIAHKP